MKFGGKNFYPIAFFLLSSGVLAAVSTVRWSGIQFQEESTSSETAEREFQEYALRAWDSARGSVESTSTSARRKDGQPMLQPRSRKIRTKRLLSASPSLLSDDGLVPQRDEVWVEKAIWSEQIVEALGYGNDSVSSQARAWPEESENGCDELWKEVGECLLTRSAPPDPERAIELLEQIERANFPNQAFIAFYRGIAHFLNAQDRDSATEREVQAREFQQAIAWLAEANSRKFDMYRRRPPGLEQVPSERLILTIPLLQGLAFYSLYLNEVVEVSCRLNYRFNARSQLTTYLGLAQTISKPPGNLVYIAHLLEKYL